MKTSFRNEEGIALVTALLVLALASGVMAGMFAALIANQKTHATDRDQSVAYAAAHAGLEKLTAALASLFAADFSPSAAQIGVVDNTPPVIPGYAYTAPGGAAGSGYEITFTPDPAPGANHGNPLAFPNTDITTGPFEGFKGLITPYTLTVTARSITGNSEVRLRRELQTVAVPVFQFGIFGEKALGFHAGPDFDFGGRVHTNESLYLAAGDGSTLTFRDKITAFTQVVRNTLSNGVSITLTNHEGTVSIPTVIGGEDDDYRNLLATESSGTTASPWSGWKKLSEVTYLTTIRTEATGAKKLQLPLATQGAFPIDLIKRPIVSSNENTANAVVFGQRYFAQASLRILLSDRAADITALPTVTADAPLEFTAAGIAGYVVGANRPPVAMSPGLMTNEVTAANGNARTQLDADVDGATQPATLPIEHDLVTAGTFADGVPPWLTVNAPPKIQGTATTLNCPTLRPNSAQLRDCDTAAINAVTAGTTIVEFTTDLGTFTGAVQSKSSTSASPRTITFTSAFTTANKFVASRVFFVGPVPVTCTGYTATSLTGCTWEGTADLANNTPIYRGATTTNATPLLNGFIKIEKQNATGVWSDVTLELLNLGFAGPNVQGDPCPDPTPNAVIRIMRLRDNGYASDLCADGTPLPATSYHTSAVWSATDFWPNLLYDAREGHSRLRDLNDGIYAGGLMSYVAFDVANFKKWVAGTTGTTGTQALNNNGYIIYFSDRRGDHDETKVGDPESGEYGNEDSINPNNATWAKSNALEVGENFNESVDGAGVPTMQTYGETPHPLAVPAGAVANLGFTDTQRPWTLLPLSYTGRARLARPVLFRRALKVIHGGLNNLPTAGFTITAENPIYIQGNYNASSTDVEAEPNVASAIIGDSITLLSNAFKDSMTFQFPNDANNRDASDTGYRFAMVTGKSIPFPKPGWGVAELGSDGGVHNFMKMLEDWGGRNLRYRGSMVSLYYSRQAIGIYRADGNIYGAPTRGYNFDTDFLTPALLPPGTPMFRDINTLKFRQILRPNQ